MVPGLLGVFDDWQARLAKERELRGVLRDLGAPNVVDLRFRKQSRNAVVYDGVLDGVGVFVKQYETKNGPKITRIGVEETSVVRGNMDGVTCGVAEILWANEGASLVLMAAVPGAPVADALSGGHVEDVMPDVARWLKQYAGSRSFVDAFSTSHWVKMRAREDISNMSEPDQTLAVKLLDLQRARRMEFGTLPARKGRFPKDFAPQNLHWTGSAVWGFDIEGYSIDPIARAIARFCVLAERRLPDDCTRQFGVHAGCLLAFTDTFDLSEDHPALMPFLIGDELLKSLHGRHDETARSAIRRAAQEHLTN